MEASAGGDRIAARATRIEPQQIRLMFELAAECAGDLVHLEFGEPDFDTPDHIVEGAVTAARAGQTKYTANAGVRELREAIAAKIDPELDTSVDAATEVIVTTGGVEALLLAMQTVVPGDGEVVIPTPTWPNPISQAKLVGGRPVTVEMDAEHGFVPEAAEIVEAIGPETAAVLLASPGNPTGRVLPRETIEAVLAAATRHDAYVIADEVYRELTYEDIPPRIDALAQERVLTVGSCSKAYAMTGWRVGWLVGPETVVEHMVKLHESTTSCVNTPAQHAAIAALTGPQEPVRGMREAFRERRDYLLSRIESIPGVAAPMPEGAFYAFVDVGRLPGTSMDIAKRLLYEYDVVAAPGTAFGPGGEDHLRFSFANDLERLALGMDRFEEMVRAEL